MGSIGYAVETFIGIRKLTTMTNVQKQEDRVKGFFCYMYIFFNLLMVYFHDII